MQFNFFSILLIISALFSLALMIFAWRKKQPAISNSLILMLLAASIWSMFYGIELAAKSLEVIHQLIVVQYIGITTQPVFWLIFAARYSGNHNWKYAINRMYLFVVPVVTVIMLATNPYHHLFYSSSGMIEVSGYSFFQLEPGLFYWINVVYSYTLLILGMFYLIRMLFHTEKIHRRRVYIFLLASLAPSIASILYHTRTVVPYGVIDITPLSFIVMGSILIIGVFGLRIFDITPFALNSLYRNMGDAVFVLSVHNKVLSMNPKAKSLISLMQRHHEPNELNEILVDQRMIGDEEQSVVEINGRYYDRTLDFVYNHQRKAIGKIISLRDITQYKKIERNLVLSKESAELANKAKSDFLSNMSHEIRTPLNGVIGFMELLKGTPLNKIQREYLNNSMISANTLMEIITDILDLSKIEAGKLELELVKTDLVSLVRSSIDIVRLQANDKQLSIHLSIPEQFPKSVLVDPLRLKQVLMNLLSNAVKFTHEGGVRMTLDFKQKDATTGYFTFDVEDTGIGISEEGRKKLFTAFTQADTSTTRQYGGTGLGLAISNSLVKKMKSEIQYESKPGVGSRFFFTIETNFYSDDSDVVGAKNADYQSANLTKNVRIAGKSVLVATASDVNALLLNSMIANLLPELPVKVLHDTNNLNAQLQRESPSLLLIDASMLTIEHERIAIGSGSLICDCPIIVLSSSTPHVTKQEWLDAGASGVLTMPFRKEELLMLINQNLGSSPEIILPNDAPVQT